mmetsp:Transcript_145015/g.255632  ORF Transcript_145015/g.255632 Transcript_145015/m.255632 type:complete len:135 (+) Transcript_145015:40-444(+)
MAAANVPLWAALENTFLNYQRNAMIAVAVGLGMIEYRVESPRPPISGCFFIGTGCLWSLLGSCSLLGQAFATRKLLPFGYGGAAYIGFLAAWPPSVWALSMSSFFDRPPLFLVAALKENRLALPRVLQDRIDNL